MLSKLPSHIIFALLIFAVAGAIQVNVNSHFEIDVLSDDDLWFQSRVVELHCNGKWYSTRDGSLKSSQTVRSFIGEDDIGTFNATVAEWDASGTPFITTVIAYEHSVVFRQSFPNGAQDTSVGTSDKTFSAFPVIELASLSSGHRRGYLAFNGDMTGSDPHSGEWSERTSQIPGGVVGTAPVVVFREDLQRAFVLAPFSNFMVSNQEQDVANKQLRYGVLGRVKFVPAAFSMEFILHESRGVREAMISWGDVMLHHYGKTREGPNFDLTLTFLGYSTDNGAYYYYNTEANKTYEDTLIDVKAYADQMEIPYRYILLDSWWYPKDDVLAVTEWIAMPSIFPHGLNYLYNKTGWPVQGHNRFWSSLTPYAKQNGGKWDFVIQKNTSDENVPITHLSLPAEQEFWNWLLDDSKKWGLVNYEQDWLDDTFDKLNALQEDPLLARNWLMQMGAGAAQNGLTIQYCMSHCRHILQSVEIPAVTHTRASGDYGASTNNQWDLGSSSLFAYALGLAPSKDNYWSTQVQPGNPWGPNRQEPYSRLQSASISLSRGPVAPGDGIGYSNVGLIKMACMKDGRLLRPSIPAIEIDQVFVQRSFGSSDLPNGHLLSTGTVLNRQWYGIVASIELQHDYALSTLQAGFGENAQLVATEANSSVVSMPVRFDAQHPLHLRANNKWTFEVYTISPILTNGWAILGEVGKWVRVSEERFQSVVVLAEELYVTVRGASKEAVTVAFYNSKSSAAPITVTCVVPETHIAVMHVPSGKCT